MVTLLRAALAALALSLIQPAAAEEYPARPVRLIVPFGAGGPADVYARVIAHHLSSIKPEQQQLEPHLEGNGVKRNTQYRGTLLAFDDIDLDRFDADAIDQWLATWCKRPTGEAGPLALTTCRNTLIALRQFVRWLSRSAAFRWA